MDITATFQLTESEIRKALRNLPVMRRMTVVSGLVLVVAVLALAVDDSPNWGLVGAAVVLPLFLELGVVRGGARKTAAFISEPWTVRITEQSYSLRTPASEAEVSWSAYGEVTERGGFWFLHQTNKAVTFLPQRAFEEAQRAEVGQYFAAKLPPVKRPWYRLGF